MVWTDAGNLDNDTDDHDRSADEDGLAATETVTQSKNEDGTEEAADSINGDNETLPTGVDCGFGKVGGEFVRVDDTRHDTLVITKEQEVGGGDSSDEHTKASARRAPVGGHAFCVSRNSHFPGLSSSTGSRTVSRRDLKKKKAMLAELRRAWLGREKDPFISTTYRSPSSCKTQQQPTRMTGKTAVAERMWMVGLKGPLSFSRPGPPRG